MTELANSEIIMEVWAADRDDLIASFTWTPDNGGRTTMTFAKEDYGGPLQKFIDDGLGEWVKKDGEERARVTLSNDAYFLPHLAAHIRQLNGMRIQLNWGGRTR